MKFPRNYIPQIDSSDINNITRREFLKMPHFRSWIYVRPKYENIL